MSIQFSDVHILMCYFIRNKYNYFVIYGGQYVILKVHDMI